MSYESDLLRPYIPPGFEKFWKDLTSVAIAAPLEFEIKNQCEFDSTTHSIRSLSFNGIDGSQKHGWIAEPYNLDPSPGFLWLAPYSRWSMLPNQYGVREGMTSLSFNFHGESAFHQEDYTPERGYMAEGILDRSSWIFGRMYQDSVLAGRILESLDSVRSDQIIAAGMSQGGGLAIWLGAWANFVSAVVADEPFLAGVPWILDAKYFRYPLKELTDVAFSSSETEEKVRKTLSFFDTINQAAFCSIPTRLTLGLKDPSVRPAQVKAVYETLTGPKELEELDWGHDWHPNMITGAKNFLKQHLFSAK